MRFQYREEGNRYLVQKANFIHANSEGSGESAHLSLA